MRFVLSNQITKEITVCINIMLGVLKIIVNLNLMLLCFLNGDEYSVQR